MNKRDVEQFLIKCKIACNSNFLFIWNSKNKATMTWLGYTQDDVIDEIKTLQAEDYFQGPLVDRDGYKNPFWVFGKTIQGREIYIKVKVKDCNDEGEQQLTTLCISFHFSEYPLTYPFK